MELNIKINQFKSHILYGNETIVIDQKKIFGDYKHRKKLLRQIRKDGSYITEESKLYVLEDVYVDFSTGLVFNKNEVLEASRINRRSSMIAINNQTINEDYKIITNIDNVEKISKQSFLMAGLYENNYYHWHVEILTRMISIEYIVEEELSIYFNTPNTFQNQMLKYTAEYISNLECVFIPNKRIVKFEKLYYSPDTMGRYPRYSHRIIDFYNTLKAKVKVSVQDSRYIFVTRKGNNRRVLENEDEIISILEKKWGFVAVDPGIYSYEEQVNIFSNAKVIIGPHGAALTNLLYTNSSSTLIELFSEKHLNLGLQRLALLKGLFYYYLVGETTFYNEAEKLFQRYKIPVEKLLTITTQVIDKIED